MMVAASPESMPENHIHFRAPPPSPVASGRRSSFTNDDVLTEFLENAPRVPHLVLPDKIFPRQKIVETPPKVDFQSLNRPDSDSIPKVLDSVTRMGCFQLVNHGISDELLLLVLASAAGIFRMSPENKAKLMRSPENPYGFEEVYGEEVNEFGEEFVWCRDGSFMFDVNALWTADGYQKFSERMEALLSIVENAAEKILQVLEERNSSTKWMCLEGIAREQEDMSGPICCIHKHRRNVLADGLGSSLGYDAMRMLIRGSDHSHALAFHIRGGSSEFHVYSRKGWVSFCPDKDAIVVTVGDQTQAWSGGQYKHVLGRPIFKVEDDEHSISMAVLYSPPRTTTTTTTNHRLRKGKTLSFGQQAMLFVIFTLIYQFFTSVYK